MLFSAMTSPGITPTLGCFWFFPSIQMTESARGSGPVHSPLSFGTGSSALQLQAQGVAQTKRAVLLPAPPRASQATGPILGGERDHVPSESHHKDIPKPAYRAQGGRGEHVE